MNPDENMPHRLVDALYLINEMATDEGMDALIDAARQSGRVLDAGPKATPADVAVEVWLRWPELLDQKHAETLITRPRSFEYFLGRRGEPRTVPPDDPDKRTALEALLDDWFSANRRGRGSRVFRFDRDDRVWFLVRHGLPVKREGTLNNRKSDSVFYRPEKHDVVVFDAKRDELGINAAGKKEKKLYCELFGDHLFGERDYFPSDKKYTLDPLRRDGPSALVCSDVDGLENVTLVELWFFHGGKHTEIEIRKATDVFAALTVHQVVALHLRRAARRGDPLDRPGDGQGSQHLACAPCSGSGRRTALQPHRIRTFKRSNDPDVHRQARGHRRPLPGPAQARLGPLDR